MFYIVTDRENKDRQSPVLCVFRNREAADLYAAEHTAEYGQCEVVESEHLALDVDLDDLFGAIEMRFKSQRGGAFGYVTNEELADAITGGDFFYEELKARFDEGGMEAVYCTA